MLCTTAQNFSYALNVATHQRTLKLFLRRGLLAYCQDCIPEWSTAYYPRRPYSTAHYACCVHYSTRTTPPTVDSRGPMQSNAADDIKSGAPLRSPSVVLQLSHTLSLSDSTRAFTRPLRIPFSIRTLATTRIVADWQQEGIVTGRTWQL